MTPIDRTKAKQGFVPAMKRNACRNCVHGDEKRQDRMPPYDTASWSCKLGGFMTSAGAVCDRHERKPS